MRSHILLLLAICGCTQGAAESDGLTLVPFTSPDDTFSIDFPGVPQEESTPNDPLFGKVKGRLYIVDNGGFAHLVMYTRFDRRVTEIEKTLNGGRDGMLGSVGGRLLEENDIEIQGYPGREFVMEIPSERIVQRVQIVVTEFEVFQVIAGGPPGTQQLASTESYFGSFRLRNVQR